MCVVGDNVRVFIAVVVSAAADILSLQLRGVEQVVHLGTTSGRSNILTNLALLPLASRHVSTGAVASSCVDMMETPTGLTGVLRAF